MDLISLLSFKNATDTINGFQRWSERGEQISQHGELLGLEEACLQESV